MSDVQQHFNTEAHEFDDLILKLIPDYPQMITALVAAIPFDPSAQMRVLDLGSGTGTVAGNVLNAFPNAQVTCLDLAENMIEMAQAKLAPFKAVKYVVGDFRASAGEYDVVLSSLALHHLLTNEDKRRFYHRIYDSLNPDGVFYNADIVLGSSAFLQALYMKQWRTFMQRNISDDEIEDKWIPKHNSEDHPAKLVDQLRWMEQIGFVDVDVLWKYYNFAVYGGVKR